MSNIYPVILSGGSGTRLWPLSRAMYPKQFIPFNGKKQSFLAATLKRLSLESGFEAPVVLCNNDHRFLVKAEFDNAKITTRSIILEPVARNTAPPSLRIPTPSSS
jgi:mannose-1-phosphate guanylyltransferase / mannose-6-phosphate isomerase